MGAVKYIPRKGIIINTSIVMRQRNPGGWPPPAGLAPSQAALVTPLWPPPRRLSKLHSGSLYTLTAYIVE